MSHSILTALTEPLDSTLIWNLTAWFSTCAMRMVEGFPTCAPMKPASIRSSASATGITMWTAPHLQTGTIWMTWPTEQTRPKLRSMTSENKYQDKTVIKLISSLIASVEAKRTISQVVNSLRLPCLVSTNTSCLKNRLMFWWRWCFLICLLICPSYVSCVFSFSRRSKRAFPVTTFFPPPSTS